jgi:hypothetical protein
LQAQWLLPIPAEKLHAAAYTKEDLRDAGVLANRTPPLGGQLAVDQQLL